MQCLHSPRACALRPAPRACTHTPHAFPPAHVAQVEKHWIRENWLSKFIPKKRGISESDKPKSAIDIVRVNFSLDHASTRPTSSPLHQIPSHLCTYNTWDHLYFCIPWIMIVQFCIDLDETIKKRSRNLQRAKILLMLKTFHIHLPFHQAEKLAFSFSADNITPDHRVKKKKKPASHNGPLALQPFKNHKLYFL